MAMSGNDLNLDQIGFASTEEDLLNALGEEVVDDKTGDDKGESQDNKDKGKGGKPAARDDDHSGIITDEDDLNKVLEDKKEDKNKGKDKPKSVVPKDNDDPDTIRLGDEEEEDEETSEDESTLQYLNRRAKLGLKLDELPTEFSPADEKKAVYDIMNRIVGNANKRLEKYEEVTALLEDDEVRLLLEAKAEGKGLKDIASQFIQSVDGMADEDIVKRNFKRSFPTLSDQEISDMVEETKKKGTLAKVATAARDAEKKDKETHTAAEQAKAARDQQIAAQQRQNDLRSYAGWITKVKEVHGVAVSDDWKKEAYLFSTKPIDQDGNTALDLALQSDQGVFMAALGIKLMGKILRATESNSKNRGRKDILGLLDDQPQSTRSGGKDRKQVSESQEEELHNLF